MSKILITGGAGFIGAHTAKALIDEGEEVVLFDDFNSFLYSPELKRNRLEHMFTADKRPRVITGNILDAELVEEVFAGEQFDKVLHFAALANPGRSLETAEEYTLVNVNGTLQILEAARRHDITQVIFAGSSSVYNDEQTPFKEDSYPLRPRSPYGVSKAAAEQYCAMWHDLYDLPITILRFFSVYGPWGRPDMAPHIFAEQILRGETLRVTPERRRDFTYIDDIVAGIVATVERKLQYEVINLGRGEPVELGRLIEALEKASGKKAQVQEREAPSGEMRVTYADVSKARKLLGYDPKVSIDEGAAALVEWLKGYSA